MTRRRRARGESALSESESSPRLPCRTRFVPPALAIGITTSRLAWRSSSSRVWPHASPPAGARARACQAGGPRVRSGWTEVHHAATQTEGKRALPPSSQCTRDRRARWLEPGASRADEESLSANIARQPSNMKNVGGCRLIHPCPCKCTCLYKVPRAMHARAYVLLCRLPVE